MIEKRVRMPTGTLRNSKGLRRYEPVPAALTLLFHMSRWSSQ